MIAEKAVQAKDATVEAAAQTKTVLAEKSQQAGEVLAEKSHQAGQVLDAAEELSRQSDTLERKVEEFLMQVRTS